ncbi:MULTISPECIES: tetratricopeptide repeat protein [Telluria group]|uniref:Putative negative regulator of RcsB-dependent stress response n=1 Tax=Pseudoduganella violacea TaxID=1715466 RepID=A0A7W5B9C2_9BURK|nr:MULTISPECIES: tetratricopeptide repeat protein [Telluria group]MBB3118818.1 putative negative regulator of RcsB-dependent stress response [Pseudoduganella violacea]NVD98634.1 tetratricopeptide repeat protein [Massilia sp. BJB1822]
MAYDLEEQEQLASLKAWWAKYGNLTSWVVIAGLAAFSGWNGWNYYQRNQAAQASTLYDEMQTSVGKDNAKVQRAAGDIQSRFGATAYAQMSALVAAKSAFDANDMKAAKAQLQWVIEKGNEEYKAVAKLRLAGVLLDEKAYDEALKVLAGDSSPQFSGAVADRKGDILVAQNKLVEARAAYKAALDATDKKNPGRQLIELKLEAIGGSVPEEKAAA